jgi:hypothetical protein
MVTPHFKPKNTVTKYVDALSHRVMYRVVSPTGDTLADAIDSERLARQIACMDELYDAFTYTLSQYRSHILDCVYDLGWDTGTWEELALDTDGEYEIDYPGLPEEAELVVLFGEIEDFVEPPKYY